MDYRRVEGDREYLATMEHGRDWRGQIEDFADEEGIDAAFFVGLGAVEDATLFFYDQDDLEYDSMRMYSGAGHDAMNVANVGPTAMLFVPSQDGISHNPDEYTSPDDLATGARVLERGLRSLADC